MPTPANNLTRTYGLAGLSGPDRLSQEPFRGLESSQLASTSFVVMKDLFSTLPVTVIGAEQQFSRSPRLLYEIAHPA